MSGLHEGLATQIRKNNCLRPPSVEYSVRFRRRCPSLSTFFLTKPYLHELSVGDYINFTLCANHCNSYEVPSRTPFLSPRQYAVPLLRGLFIDRSNATCTAADFPCVAYIRSCSLQVPTESGLTFRTRIPFGPTKMASPSLFSKSSPPLFSKSKIYEGRSDVRCNIIL
ncbi:hypothetical protein M405DRAFT_397261 [Rhizopogon salebrosus TDB-379]|nr:hypothetical protein M405DRAFT_397261 [Rhizopogon salebrosus TDB-379]